MSLDGGNAPSSRLTDVWRVCLGRPTRIKGSARDAVEKLHEERPRVVMLAGDNLTTALAVARRLGLADVRAEVLPDQKKGRVAIRPPGIVDPAGCLVISRLLPTPGPWRRSPGRGAGMPATSASRYPGARH